MPYTIRIKVYAFSELNAHATFKAINDEIEMQLKIMDENSPYWPVVEEMERMQTPWFIAETIYHDPKYRQMIIDDLIAQDPEFTQDGKRF